MRKIVILKNMYWLMTLAAILSFYILINNSIESLLDKNKLLDDSLKVLESKLHVLDSLLQTVPPDASFSDTIINQSQNSVTVKFIPNILNANRYKWDFGDGKNSSDTTPMHKYTVTKTQEFRVTLIIDVNGKTFTNNKIIRLQGITDSTIADASFDTATVSRNAGYLTMKFSPGTRNAETYEWDFGNGQTSKSKDSRQTFDLNKTLKYSVKLKITINGKRDEKSKKLVFKKITEVKISIRLDKNIFSRCDSTKYKFILSPTGGIVTGQGVSKINELYFFIPSKVIERSNKVSFKYILLKDTAYYSVTLSKLNAVFSKDSAAYKDGRQFIFTPVEKNAESYSWEVIYPDKSRRNSTEMVFTVIPYFNRSANGRQKYIVQLTLTKSGCTESSNQSFYY